MHGNAEDPHRNKPEDEHSKTKIAPNIAEHFKSTMTFLSRRDLLKKCKRGATQSNNESFHNAIWNLARKIQFVSCYYFEASFKFSPSEVGAEVEINPDDQYIIIGVDTS